MIRTHFGQHDDCFGCKIRTVQYGPVIDVAPQTLTERRWDRDMPAYARLRRDGLQPRSVDGAGDLEQRLVGGQMEIDMGHLLQPHQYAQATECMEECQDVSSQIDWSETVAAYKHKQAQP